MSTATNLLSLLNQLQLMENSLTNFMLETILKIQSLTETKVFLLLESSGGAEGGRRYCGTRDLVESFENGRFQFRPTDVEVTLDPAIDSSVVEKARAEISLPHPRMMRNKRSCNSEPIDGATPVKRLQMTPGVDGGVEELPVYAEEEGVGQVVKTEVEEYVIGDSDDESRTTMCVRQRPPLSWANAAHVTTPQTDFNADQFRPSNVMSARKLDALTAIENPAAVFEKGTLENKLLSSILYDYGKELALKCPYEDVTLASADAKSYFYGNLEQFLTHFQRFTVEKTIVSDLLKAQSPQSYMRNIARSGYKAAAKNAMKGRTV